LLYLLRIDTENLKDTLNKYQQKILETLKSIRYIWESDRFLAINYNEVT